MYVCVHVLKGQKNLFFMKVFIILVGMYNHEQEELRLQIYTDNPFFLNTLIHMIEFSYVQSSSQWSMWCLSMPVFYFTLMFFNTQAFLIVKL